MTEELREPPILFADQTPSKAKLKVRRGGMKLVRGELKEKRDGK